MNKLKTICMFSIPRSGSTWLIQNIKINSCLCAVELFNVDTSLKEYNKIFTKYKNLVNTNSNDVAMSHIRKDKLGYLNFCKEEVSTEYDYLLFKVFPIHIGYDKSIMKDIAFHSEYIIINYRKNFLSLWISYQKAKRLNVWHVNNTDNHKVVWDGCDFLRYREECLNFLNHYLDIRGDKPWIVLSYEEFHENGMTTNLEKKEYLRTKLQTIGLNVNDELNEKYIKQSLIKNPQDHFVNDSEFELFDKKHLFYMDFNVELMKFL